MPLSKNSKPHIQSINTAKLKILNRTDDLIFINKPLGITTHGKDSIDEIVKREFTPSFSLSFSVGALHRLDKDTTGILTFSQSLKGATEFSKAIKMGGISRYYIGINEGYLENAIWKLPYKDNEDITKEEITKVFLLEYAKKENLSLNCYRLFTGKKHQIRKGATHFGKPLFCDTRYGSKCKKNQTYFLHSFALVFQEKLFLDLPKIIIAPLPNRFLLAIKQYFKATWQNMEKINEISFLRQLLAKEDTSN